MNLVNGEILDTKACDSILDELEQRIENTLQKDRLEPELVIAACGKLLADLDEQAYIDALTALGIDDVLSRRYVDEARQLLNPAYLRCRLNAELGENHSNPYTYTPLFYDTPVTEQIYPMGVLLHVAAGNVDGLPAFSVFEGLLTGNINILKLPEAEGGISVRLLSELVAAEPRLAEYVYVFEYSSKDVVHIEKLINAVDAVVVWGGAQAVSALRKIVPPNIRIIEWGHKISFAYVTAGSFTDDDLAGLATNIAHTGQLLCSSLQGIYIDTDDMNVIYNFCNRFLPILNDTIVSSGNTIGIGVRAHIALKLYNEELEGIYSGGRVYKGTACSLTAYPRQNADDIHSVRQRLGQAVAPKRSDTGIASLQKLSADSCLAMQKR